MNRKQDILKGRCINGDHLLLTDSEGKFLSLIIYLAQGKTQITIDGVKGLKITAQNNDDMDRQINILSLTKGYLEIK